MSRPGITYSEVADAANQLIGKGRTPTIDQIRLIIGSGSISTISKHLRTFKSNQNRHELLAQKESIPSDLVFFVKGLWERLQAQAEEQILKKEGEFQKNIQELQAEVEKYKANNQRWQKMHDQWVTEKKNLSAEKQTLEKAIDFAYKENASLKTKEDGYITQFADKQSRVEELLQLHYKQLEET